VAEQAIREVLAETCLLELGARAARVCTSKACHPSGAWVLLCWKAQLRASCHCVHQVDLFAGCDSLRDGVGIALVVLRTFQVTNRWFEYMGARSLGTTLSGASDGFWLSLDCLSSFMTSWEPIPAMLLTKVPAQVSQHNKQHVFIPFVPECGVNHAAHIPHLATSEGGPTTCGKCPRNSQLRSCTT
jgi:hypothetical protein